MASLEKTLSFPVILLITINSIMGTGIFFLPSSGAGVAGPTSIISWILMAILSMGIGLVFAELVGMYPFAGGVYEYCKQAFGSFPSFLLGWMTMIAGNITIAMLVVGAIRYLNPSLPPLVNIGLSIFFVLIFNAMAYRGMQTSAMMLVTFGIITISSVVGLTIPGLFSFKAANLVPFWTHPFSATLLAVFFIAETFFGWETATFLAEETKDAEHVMPRAMWLATLLIGIMCVSFVVVSLANIPWQTFSSSATPLADLAAHYFGSGALAFASIIVYLAIIGTVAGWVVSAPRLIMSLAEDKLFLHQLAEIHPKYKTPYKAIIFQTLLASVLVVVGSASFEAILHLLLPVAISLYAAVLLAFIVLRYTRSDHPRPFKLWAGVPFASFLFLCLIGMVVYWAILDPTAVHTLTVVASFLLLGIPLYLLLLFTYNPDAILAATNLFAYWNVLLEDLLLPKRLRREILFIFRGLEGKHILEYGAGVGTLTLRLAEQVLPGGRVTATDLSAKNIRILERRLQKRGIVHVRTLHDSHHVNRIHPDVKDVDVVFSVGALGYVQDLRKVLKDLHRILPERGKVCFVEYVDYFKFLPNPKLLSDEAALKEEFRKSGYSVQVAKVKGLLWSYLFIYGEKTKHVHENLLYV